MDEQTYTELYMECIAQCFMMFWVLRQAHFKEVSLTRNLEIMAFQNLTSLDWCNLLCRRTHINRMVMKSLFVFVLTLHFQDLWPYEICGMASGWVSRALIILWSQLLAIVWSGHNVIWNGKAVCLSAMCTVLNFPSLICYIHCVCFGRLNIKKKKQSWSK